MWKAVRGALMVGLAVVVYAAFDARAGIIKTFPRVTTTTNQTFTYYTSDANTAQVTVTADDGSPNGTVVIRTRQTVGGSATTVVTVASPTGTKTYTGEAQGVLEIVVTNLTVGTIGFEVLTK